MTSQFPFSGDCNGLVEQASSGVAAAVCDCFSGYHSETQDSFLDPSTLPCYLSDSVLFWAYIVCAVSSCFMMIMLLRTLHFWFVSGGELGMTAAEFQAEIWARPRIHATIVKLISLAAGACLFFIRSLNVRTYAVGRDFTATLPYSICIYFTFYMSSARIGMLIASCKSALMMDRSISDSASMLKVVLEQMEHVMMAFNVFIALGLLVAPVATLLPELTPTQDASVLLAALLPVAVGLLGYFFVGYYFVVIKVPLTLLMSIDFSTSMLPEVLRSDSVLVLTEHLLMPDLARGDRSAIQSILRMRDVRDEFLYSGKSNTIPYAVLGVLRVVVVLQPQLLAFCVLCEGYLLNILVAVSWRSYRVDIAQWRLKTATQKLVSRGAGRNSLDMRNSRVTAMQHSRLPSVLSPTLRIISTQLTTITIAHQVIIAVEPEPVAPQVTTTLSSKDNTKEFIQELNL